MKLQKKRNFILLAMTMVLLLSACGDNKTAKEGNYPNEQLLADSKWVNDNLDKENLVIIDARSEGYNEGHIQGAVSLGAGQINDAENEIDGFLLGEEDFTALLSGLGVNQDSEILVYDDGNALSATRIFYALEFYGLQDQVKVLNGGYPAWLTEGYDISVDPTTVTAGNFVAKANDKLVSTKDDVLGSLDSEEVVILDARSEGEYTGADLRKNANGGHIPGAVNQEWTSVLEKDENGLDVFSSYDTLLAKFEQIGVVEDKTVIPYCQTNVRGAHTYFTLRLLGYTDIRPYEGSWSEWGNTEGTPIEI
ncbi:sulfurtransferase [Paenibacillus sp. FA6]|uniref:sulfurtransferase n=1 Tax=Paenibacillus sp. FA6 TaxID=3413029 RepID=UPI003F655912